MRVLSASVGLVFQASDGPGPGGRPRALRGSWGSGHATSKRFEKIAESPGCRTHVPEVVVSCHTHVLYFHSPLCDANIGEGAARWSPRTWSKAGSSVLALSNPTPRWLLTHTELVSGGTIRQIWVPPDIRPEDAHPQGADAQVDTRSESNLTTEGFPQSTFLRLGARCSSPENTAAHAVCYPQPGKHCPRNTRNPP